MRFLTRSLALVCVLGGALAAHATDMTYYIHGGTVSPIDFDGASPPDTVADTISGYVTINSVTGLVDGGRIDTNIDSIDYPNQVWLPGTDRPVAGGSYVYFGSGVGPSDGITNIGIYNPGGAAPVFCSATSTPICANDPNGFQASTEALSEAGLHFISGGSFAATPEPSSLLLFGTGLASFVGTARRRFGKA